MSQSTIESVVAPVEPTIQSASGSFSEVTDAVVNTANSQINATPSIHNNVQPTIQPEMHQVTSSSGCQHVQAPEGSSPQEQHQPKQIIPAGISSLPSTLASQAQSQVSGFQSQVSSLGGNVLSQIQNQVSSAQSQVAALPASIIGILPTGILPSSTNKVIANQPLAPVDPVMDQPSLLSEPINQTTKLVIDVEEQIKKYLPSEDQIVTTVPTFYASDVVESKDERQQNQIAMLIDQVNILSDSIEVTSFE